MQTIQDQYKTLLKDFLALKTISTDRQFHLEHEKAITWLEDFFQEAGFTSKRLLAEGINPFLLASYEGDPKAETILIYGHYDVQPAPNGGGWESDPFELTERENRLFGRGVVDNKGQVLIHMVTVRELIRNGTLRYNVKFLLEGNEESGNPKMREVLEANREALSADKILISDGQLAHGSPTIEMGLRGCINLSVKLRTANSALHSGLFGGAAPNAVYELSKLVSSLIGPDGRVTIANFYDGVEAPAQEVCDALDTLLAKTDQFCGPVGVKRTVTPEGVNPYVATGLLPTLQLTGIQGGYSGDGFMNIVPNEAVAKINVRLVAHQDPEALATRIVTELNARCPDYASIVIEQGEAVPAVRLTHNESVLCQAEEAIEAAFGQKPVHFYCGGSLPLVLELKEVFGIDPLLVSLGNHDCNMHGVNENFDLELLPKALNFSSAFLGECFRL